MRNGNKAFAILAAVLCLLKHGHGLTNGVSSCNAFRTTDCIGDFYDHSLGWAYNVSQLK